MTVTSTTNIVRYEGNGATTSFSYSFLIPTASDTVITYTDADGVETVLNTTQYSITGLDDSNGGTVTYPLTGSPIAANTFLTIQRELELVQDTDLTNQDGFYPQTVEDALDYLTMLIQQISTLNSQAIRVPSAENPPNALPAAADRASQTLIFDSTGQPTVGSVTGTTVSTAMQPVVGAATLLSARSLMGVGYLPVAKAVNYSVLAADISSRFMSTGALVFTMPDSTQVVNGFNFGVYALTADCTLTPVGTDTIYGYGLGVSAIVSAGQTVEIVTDGAGNWWLTAPNEAPFVGQIQPAGLFLAPSAKWDLCDGGSYLRASFPALFTATTMSLTVTKTNGNPVLGGFTSAQTAKLAAGMLVEGTGIPAGATILTTPSAGDTSITLDQNSTNGTSVTATIIPFGAADTTHANRPDFRGRVLAGAELATNAATRLTTTYFGSVPRLGRAGTASESGLVLKVNFPSSGTFTVTDPRTWASTNNLWGSGGTGGRAAGAEFSLSASSQPITVSGAAPTAAIGGSDTPITKVQPTSVAMYLIRVLP